MTEYQSKHSEVARQPYELYMVFTDLRNLAGAVPGPHRQDLKADADSLHASVQGFDVGVKVAQRTPYSRLVLVDDGAPFIFKLTLCFDPAASDPFKTDFHIELEAELNIMMKMLLGSKIKEGLDKVVDGLAAISEGRVPDGIDPDILKNFGGH